MKSVINKRIVIGKIGAPHGVQGDVKVYPLTDFPDRFANLKTAFIDEEVIEIISTRYQGNFIVMRIKGINSRETAARYTNKLMQVERSEVPPLAPGEYYSFDIIGLNVFSVGGDKLGTIREILKTGSNDVYVVQTGSGKQLLVPALKKVVTEINLEASTMTVNWTEPE